ncbi:MAG TPA: winged helix-turn-helix domain-containing protein [Baekduia sp.]|uniref:winged helix-turn-helix domain-containing protein n=1 Tax=Baekduia sp. TaxID=2600305 RepID=UPI002D79DF20|nr:winged helix-turn-helix domain-containing protein [Baekduia sp.]HET6505204.1 winged helix-turn-helix domain-containing protein [Baekduia sp.]
MILSPRSTHLLSVLKDPVRLTILMQLERRPRSAAELARDLDMPYDKVSWAVRALARGGLAELRSAEPGPSGQTIQKVYGTRHSGWAQLPPILDAIAASAPDEAR